MTTNICYRSKLKFPVFFFVLIHFAFTIIMFKLLLLLVVVVGLLASTHAQGQQQQSPKIIHLGTIFPLSHGVSGQVYARDDRIIEIRNLNYDGQAPDAYFWAGTGEKPSITGFPIPDENGAITPLKAYRNANVVLTLPEGKTLRDITYLGLYCRKFQENFGHIKVNVK